VREHVRFGEALGEPIKEQQRGLGYGMGQEEFGAGESNSTSLLFSLSI